MIRTATVVGAGIAGLSVALALARTGISVTILEQAETVREVGAGLQVSRNGLVVLAALGLADAVDGVSTRATAVELRNGVSGRLVLRLDFGDRGSRFVHRGDLIAVLAGAARAAGVMILTQQHFASVGLSEASAVWSSADRTGMSDILIGADGLHSNLRAVLNGASVPLFTGQVAWRAVLPEHPAAGGGAVAEIHMGPGRHLVSYPLRGGTLRNIVAVEERAAWAAEGWMHPDDPGNLRAAFAGFGPRVRDWLARVETTHLWGLFRHPVAACWHRHGAVILGDAAHPMLPFLAQGANMALEDAFVLARALAAHTRPAEAFDAYQSARRARVIRVAAAAAANARNFHLRRPWRDAADLVLRIGGAVAPDLALRRYDWLYGHDVTA